MFRDLFTVPRNRRATLASWIVMFMQRKLPQLHPAISRSLLTF
jgi:hypothetical protein